MAKKKEVVDHDTSEREGDPNVKMPPPNVELFKVEVLDSETVINCHELDAGTVIELSKDDILNHQFRGVRLGEVKPDDDREVFNVHAPVNGDE